MALKERIAANRCPRAKIKEFDINGYIGGGGYGAVVEAEWMKKKRLCVIKIQNKSHLVESKVTESVIREKKIQYACRSAFICRVRCSCQDWKNIYLVMDYALFGDLRKNFQEKKDFFTERAIKFCVAQVVLALEYLHASDILHRDLKLENILVFEDGYIKLSDFGSAKQVPGTTATFVGTVHYLPPEVIHQIPYRTGFDIWTLGVLIYVLFHRDFPFTEVSWSNARNFDAIQSGTLTFPGKRPMSEDAIDLTKQLLEREVSKRIGVARGGIKAIKRHPWFADINFIHIFRKEVPSDFGFKHVEAREMDPSILIPEVKMRDPFRDEFIEF
ncbi:cAMP-dependent protein kinase catalytic subunit gamma-like [Galendromus occidentalis]|uniref:cAMP-dependent protein kinase catalytic subunit gamma-like n=1 Tax=Galendromus occidentalis TaxID=34638 RepID=A0AAJ6QQG0_9ACAR|nr:cAMP-dependent protein kinase catalytic subunit gamma-like [Galendromus occidentalis]